MNRITEPQICHCTEPGCNNTFRWIPGFPPIKPKRCNVCENLHKFGKQKEYAERSQKRKKEKLQNERTKESSNGRGAHTIGINYPKARPIKRKQRLDNQIFQSFPKNVPAERTTSRKQTKVSKRTHWTDLPTNELIQYVQQKIVNPYIRKRDKASFGNKCICCNAKIEEAGHYYSVGSTPEMRLMPENIHGQAHTCNSTKGGFGNPNYTKGLIARFGQKYLHSLYKLHADAEKRNTKLMRHEIIDIAHTYKFLSREKIWVYTSEEFNQYLIQSEQASA